MAKKGQRQTEYDRIIDRVKRHRLGAWVLVGSAAVVGLATFLGALGSIASLFRSDTERELVVTINSIKPLEGHLAMDFVTRNQGRRDLTVTEANILLWEPQGGRSQWHVARFTGPSMFPGVVKAGETRIMTTFGPTGDLKRRYSVAVPARQGDDAKAVYVGLNLTVVDDQGEKYSSERVVGHMTLGPDRRSPAEFRFDQGHVSGRTFSALARDIELEADLSRYGGVVVR